MPLFEYQCKKCGSTFERLVSPGGERPKCDACGSLRIEKLLSTFSPKMGRRAQPSACGTGAPCASACSSGGACPYSCSS